MITNNNKNAWMYTRLAVFTAGSTTLRGCWVPVYILYFAAFARIEHKGTIFNGGSKTKAGSKGNVVQTHNPVLYNNKVVFILLLLRLHSTINQGQPFLYLFAHHPTTLACKVAFHLPSTPLDIDFGKDCGEVLETVRPKTRNVRIQEKGQRQRTTTKGKRRLVPRSPSTVEGKQSALTQQRVASLDRK